MKATEQCENAKQVMPYKQLFYISLWIKELRIYQWVKNIFIFAPLFFSGKFLDPASVLKSVYFFLLFCMVSSGIYIFNDIIDRDRDRAHPKKKLRPIASGQIEPLSAIAVASVLCAASLLLGFTVNIMVFAFLVMYIVNNIIYSTYLKHKVLADVLSISIGFMIRFVGGAYVISVEPSRWLLVCGFALSLFLAFGKRRAEIEMLNGAINGASVRMTLESYSKEKLNSALSVVNSLCIMTYLLYVTDPQTISLHHSDKLIYTVPIVVYCLFRYMHKVQEGAGAGPVEIIFRDKAFVGAILLWGLAVLFILY